MADVIDFHLTCSGCSVNVLLQRPDLKNILRKRDSIYARTDVSPFFQIHVLTDDIGYIRWDSTANPCLLQFGTTFVTSD